MERSLLIQELKKTENGLNTTYSFEPEQYIGAVFSPEKSYLVSKRRGEVVFKPCVIDASVEFTPEGLKTQAEFYFYSEETGTQETREMLETINETGSLNNDIGFTQGWDFRAYAVDNQDLFYEIKEMKERYPNRSIRDAFEMESLRAEILGRKK